MALERAWDSIGPVAFTVDGGADGIVTVASVSGMRVKQQVIISSISQPTKKDLEIKKVLSLTKIIVGPIKTTGEFLSRANLSAYTVSDLATIKIIDQKKSRPTPNDIIAAVYEQEPVVAIRTFGVDELGNPWSSTNPLPTTANVTMPEGGLEVTNINKLFSKPFDQMTVLSKNDDGDPLTIRTRLTGVNVQLMTITYDIDGDFQDALVSDL